MAILAGAVTGPVAAAGAPPVRSSLLWATVNICDTGAHPDTVGVRGAMPGSGVAAEQMHLRIRLQYLSAPEDEWRDLGAAGDSGWMTLGSARVKQRQAGRSFVLRTAQANTVLRGLVSFEWRRDGDVVRRARRQTAAGHGPTAGADPAGYSTSRCRVAG